MFEGQSPVVLVDGVIIDGGLNSINSEDIESIEVLKSSSAAAIYGSRGANGVIVIKTRRGNNLAEGTSRIVFRNEIGQNFLPGRVSLSGMHPYVVNPATGTHDIGDKTLNPEQLQNTPYTSVRNYQDDIFTQNPFYTNYLSFTGNSEKVNYLVSGQNTRQPGVIAATDGLQRLNFKANIDFKVSDDLTISASNFFSTSENDNVVGNPFFDVLIFRPDLDLNEQVPNPDDPASTILNGKPDSSVQSVNPLYTLNNQSNKTFRDRYIGNVGINYSPTNWLTFEGFLGIDKDFIRGESVVPLGYLADDVSLTRIRVGGLDVSRARSSALTSRANIVLSKTFGDLSLSSRIGYWYESTVTENFSANGDAFTLGRIETFNNIQNVTNVATSSTEVNSENGLVQVGAVYKDKLSLDILGRQDAVSLFGADARSSSNYRVAASYRITEDIDIPQVQELKIRASRATSGVWPRFSAQYETFGLTAGTPTRNTLGNTLLKPATAVENEFGLNANFLNRFTLDVTYVINDTKDQIILVPLPAVSGFPNQWQNAGNLEYNGLEITLGANIMNTDKFRWDANVNFDTYEQEVTDLPIPEFRRGTGIQQSDVFLIKEGEPLGAIFATKWMRDLNEVLIGTPEADLSDFTINDEGYVVRAADIGTANEVPLAFVDAEGTTVHKVGDTNADFNLSFNSTLTFNKNLKLYFLFDWKQGGDIYSQTLQFLTRDNRAGYQDQLGKANPKPVNYYQAFYNTNNPSSFFVYDGSYLKLRELSLTYSVPTSALGSVGDVLKGITVGIVGRNIFTVTDYPGYDPEVGQGNQNVDRTTYALDGFGYPNFRTFSGSIQLTF